MKWFPVYVLLGSCILPFFATAAGDPAREIHNLDFFREGAGMHLSPGLLEKLDSLRSRFEGTRFDQSLLKILARRWGLQSVEGEVVGLKNVDYKMMKVGVVGCAACHSGKAAGQYIVGIGNKNIDPGQMGLDGVVIEKEYRRLTDFARAISGNRKSEDEKVVEKSSIRLMKKLSDPRLSASTQGLVPVALVGSWFYEKAGMPVPNNGFKGATKVPSWFGFKEKLKVGQFADAIGAGHPPGWIIGVEITAGQTPNAVRRYAADIDHAVELISSLQPPKYPFAIDSERAGRGKDLFENHCMQCHGAYERRADGTAVYAEPKIVEWENVLTDADRLNYVTDDFLEAVRKNPLSDLIQLSKYAGKKMYVAPRLHGIWARFPYLHNGSVPTLRALLDGPGGRPDAFSLKDAGEFSRFDQKTVGLTHTADDRVSSTRDLVGRRRRWIYDTRIQGQSNLGHEKSSDLTSAEKDDLIEYLKTL